MDRNKRKPHKTNLFFKYITKKYVYIPLIAVILLVILYLTAVFSPIPFIARWRSIYIETAMTTADHQWLATAFIPKSVIDKVMVTQPDISDIIGGEDHLTENTDTEETDTTGPEETTSDTSDTTDTPPETDISEETSAPPVKVERPEDILGQKKLKVGDKDYAGNKILVNDIKQGLIISEINQNGFRGKVMLIDDPARVYLGTTKKKNVEGTRIRAMMQTYGAIAGINASGFADPNDSGHGGDVIGKSYDGEYWGEYVDYYGSILITKDDKLVVGNVTNWEKYDIRAGIQFGPALIADGKATIIGTGGYGIHPRTAIGQREDGVIVFLVIDGRQVGWSIGCTMDDLISVLLDYDVVNAACCDGGSSSVLAYNGYVVNKNSSKNPDYGRRLPNAFLVAPKENSDD